MIVVEKARIATLYNGRPITVEVSQRLPRLSIASVGHSRKASCQAQVIKCEQTETGWTVTLKALSGDKVRLMTRSGYVEAPVELNPDDPDVLVGGRLTEPEPLDAVTLERFAAEGYAGHARRKALELRRQHVRSATIRLREAERREDWDAYRQALEDLRRVAQDDGNVRDAA